ncbi:MAG: hypothetical protein H6721_06780 [Sandaracinus sp.]|nr:hypothetical protein [Myxococcales bacterium]MCB9604047.1 hypothetical protein [Sandaracinus sp.]MCB9612920.1 hypothetical protein [Sandaracinus sp.]MCB9631826.1 hypothetical protein [Sandaracinus sp.]
MSTHASRNVLERAPSPIHTDLRPKLPRRARWKGYAVVATVIGVVLLGIASMARFAEVDEAAAGAVSASPVANETSTSPEAR